MLKVKELKVKCEDPDSLDLTWVFESPEEGEDPLDFTDYKIDVYRGQSPSKDLSEYVKVGEDLDPDVFNFEDTSVEGLYHSTRKWFYLLDVKKLSTGENEIQPDHPSYLNGGIPNRRFLKIVKHKKIALRNSLAGRDLLLLKRRTWGERSDREWDDVLFTPNSDTHLPDNTWDTGWKDGYFKPLKIKGMINANPNVNEISKWGEFYPSDAVLHMLNKPPIKPKDIIINESNERFYIQQIRYTEMLGKVLEQEAQISRIHPEDIIYKYNVSAYR